MTLLIGEPKNKKSFAALQMCFAVTSGGLFMNRTCIKRPAVYIAFEGWSGMQARYVAYHRLQRDDSREPIFLIQGIARLTPGSKDLEPYVDGIIRLLDEELGDKQPALIIIDTVAQSMEGNENDGRDISRYLNEVNAFRLAYPDVGVILVHHPSKEEPYRPRGHTSLPATVDGILQIKSSRARGRILVTGMKDGPSDYMMHFDTPIMTVDVPMITKEGEHVMRPVSVPMLIYTKDTLGKREAPPTPTPKEGKKQVGNASFLSLIDPQGSHIDTVMELFREQVDEKGKESRDDPKQNRAFKQRFRVVRLSLIDLGLITVDNGVIKLTDAGARQVGKLNGKATETTKNDGQTNIVPFKPKGTDQDHTLHSEDD